MAYSCSDQLLDVVEEALVSNRPFGSSDYLHAQHQYITEVGLESLSSSVPSAGRLLRALRHSAKSKSRIVVLNTVVRCAIQHAQAMAQIEGFKGLPGDDCQAILDAAARYLEDKESKPSYLFDFTYLSPLQAGTGWTHIWHEEHPGNLFGRSFRSLVDHDYNGPLCSPSDDEKAHLERGAKLLQELVPMLWESVSSHVSLVALFPYDENWKGTASSSQIKIGGTIFLSRLLLRDPWAVAEHLLHESLHQKLYDFRHGHSLLNPEFASKDAPKICSLWNAEEFNDTNMWDAHRSFAAFHVYVHLHVLSVRAESRRVSLEAEYGPSHGLIKASVSFERAWYLGEKIREVSWGEIGDAGREMHAWLMSVLGILNPSPPPAGTRLPLLLNLYEREAGKAKSALMNAMSYTALAEKMLDLADRESCLVAGILRNVEGAVAPENLVYQGSTKAKREVADFFMSARMAISKALRKSSNSGFRLQSRNPAEDPDAVVETMVRAGSYELHTAMQNLPVAVAAAKVRAWKCGFKMSCDDRVGNLLSVLASTVPLSGRILEIGTGVGVGTAWLATGLQGREDVEFVTIEINPAYSAIAAGWNWRPGIRILTEDALQAIEGLGEFDLIFADAAPMKYDIKRLEKTIERLRQRGLFVVDDLEARSSEALPSSDVGFFKQHLLNHDGLRTTYLEYGTGIILASRV